MMTHFHTEAKFTLTDDSYSSGPPDVDIHSPLRPKKQYVIGHAFAIALVVLEVLGLCCIAALIIWMSNYQNGLGWDGGEKEFNLHGIFMVTGLIYCYANAAVTSYVFRKQTETCVHYLHFLALSFTLLFTVFGSIAGINVVTKDDVVNVKSFHSWLGILTLSLFVCQIIIGFIGLFPKLGLAARKKYIKLQIWIALIVFALSITTSLLGVSDKFYLSPNRNNANIVFHERIIANVSSLFIVAFGVLLSCLLLQPIYRQVE